MSDCLHWALSLSSQIFVNPPRCCHVVPDFVIHDIQDVVIYGMAIPDVDPDGLVKIKPHVRLLALGSSRPWHFNRSTGMAPGRGLLLFTHKYTFYSVHLFQIFTYRYKLSSCFLSFECYREPHEISWDGNVRSQDKLIKITLTNVTS